MIGFGFMDNMVMITMGMCVCMCGVGACRHVRWLRRSPRRAALWNAAPPARARCVRLEGIAGIEAIEAIEGKAEPFVYGR
jgi:hypothetical protein